MHAVKNTTHKFATFEKVCVRYLRVWESVASVYAVISSGYSRLLPQVLLTHFNASTCYTYALMLRVKLLCTLTNGHCPYTIFTEYYVSLIMDIHKGDIRLH